MPEKKQSGRNRVKQSALSHEHGQRNTFPRNCFVALVIEELECLEKLEAGDTAIEQKAGHAERAAPSIKSIKGGEGREQSGPDQAASEIDVQQAEQRVKQIGAGGIS